MGLDTTAKTALIGKSIVVADPLTLKVTTEAPAAYFLSKMSYPTFWGVPQQLIDKYGQAKWTDHLTDNGPFGGNLYMLTAGSTRTPHWPWEPDLRAQRAFLGQEAAAATH